MLNSGRRGKRASDGYGIISVNEKFNQTNYPIPIINSWSITDGSYNPTSATALSTAGGETVVVYGSGFTSGVTVNINGTNVSPVTLLDQGRITFTSPALASASYTMYVSNTDGATAIYIPGLVYSGVPNWSSPSAGTIDASYETKNVSTLAANTFVAAGDAPVTYSVVSGNLPSGVTLSSSGALSGTLPVTNSPTTYSFTIRAYDAQMQTSDRSFSLTINPDAVTWVTPTLNGSLTVYETQQFSTPLSATSAAGYGVMYAANTLPTGISLTSSNGAFSGYANTVGTTYAQLTATANTTGRYTTSNVTFTVNQDVVTWSSPEDSTNYQLGQGTAMTNVTLSANAASGYGVQYTANALPTGVILSGSTISGTPSVIGTTYTQLTATSNTTNRTATRYISWTVSVLSDTYFPSTVLLLSANSSNTFITDSSINNTLLTTVGTVRAHNFNPYQLGYYSYQFGGTSDYLTLPAGSMDFLHTVAAPWTIECWFYATSVSSYKVLFSTSAGSQAIGVTLVVADTSTGDIGFTICKGTAGTFYKRTYTAGSQVTVNTWNHVAVTHTSGGALKIYINGIDTAYSTTGPGTGASSSTATYVPAIGRYQDSTPGGYFAGYISNLRVINGQAIYTGNFIPGTSPLLATTNTSLLSCQANKFEDNGPGKLTHTVNGTPKVTLVHPFTTVYQAGTPYYSYNFNGTTDYLTVAHNTALNLTSGNFTIEAWIYSNGTPTGNQMVIDKGGVSGSANEEYSIALTSANKIMISIGANDAYINQGMTTTGGITVGTWNHIAWTKSGSTHTVYINGVAQGTLTQTITMVDNGMPLYIGYQNSAGSNRYFNGSISNLRIVKGSVLYTGTFTPSTSPLTISSVGTTGANVAASITGTVSVLTCQDSTFKDNSANNLAFTAATNTVKPAAVSPFTTNSYTNNQITSFGSGYFNGSTDYLTYPGNIFATNNFTIEFWVYPGSNVAGTRFMGNSAAGGTWSANHWTIGLNNASNKLFLAVYNYNSSTNILTSTSSFNESSWKHVAIVRSGNNWTLYVNGVYEATTVSSVSLDGGVLYSTAVCNNLVGTDTPTNAYVSDLRITNGTALYTSNFVPPINTSTAVANTQLLILQSNQNANNSVFKDESVFGNIITRANNVSQGTVSPYSDNWSCFFNGTSAVQTPASSITNIIGTNGLTSTATFTIEAWIYQTQRQTYASFPCMMGDMAPSGAFCNFSFGPSSTGQLQFFWWDGTMRYATGSTTIPVCKWTHVAVSISSGSIKLFVNGNLETITGTSTTTNASSTQGYFAVGMEYGGTATNGYFGYISNLRIVKSALYSQNFTPSATPLLSQANTSLLTFQSNRFIDNSPNNYTLTLTSTPTVQKFSPFGAVTVPKYYSTYFNGSTDYLTIPTNVALNLTSGDFTIEAWTYWTGNNASGTVVEKDGISGTNNSQYALMLNGSSSFVFYLGNPTNSSIQSFTTSTTIQRNTWVHIAVVRSGTTVTIYQNGVSVGSGTQTTSMVDGGRAVYIGYHQSQPTSVMWDGHISNLRIIKGQALYTGTFTPSTTPLMAVANTVLLTCQDSTFKDNSSNNFTLTAATTTVKPLAVSPFTPTANTGLTYSTSTFGGSLNFDGTGDWLIVPNQTIHQFSGDFTVEGWFYLTAAGTARSFVSKGAASTGWTIGVSSTQVLTATLTTTTITGGTASINSWNHFAMVRKSGVVYLYLNGIVNGTGTVFSTALTQTDNMYIGASRTATTPMLGLLSDIRLTQSALYTSNFFPGNTPLTNLSYSNTATLSANTSPAVLLINGTSSGAFDQSRTLNFESFANVKTINFSPYNEGYYSNYVTTSNYHNVSMPALGNVFTIEYWIYPITADSHYTGASTGPLIGYNGSVFSVAHQGGWTIASSVNPAIRRWSHVALVREGTGSNQFKLYLNGTLVGTGTDATSFGAQTVAINRAGYISNLRVINNQALYTGTFTPATSPLTTSSVGTTGANVAASITGTALILTCQSNKFIDNGPSALSLTIVGNPTVVPQNPFKFNTEKSLYMDASAQDYIKSIDSNSLSFRTGDYTIECWFYLLSYNNNGIFRIPTGASGDFAMSVYSGTLFIGVGSNPTNTAAGTSKWGQWTHLMIIRKDGTANVYLDGVLSTTWANSGSYPDPTDYTNNTQITIGTHDIGYSINGYITDFRITKAARPVVVPTAPLRLK